MEQDYSHLPPEVQENIRNQILLQKIESYGKKIITPSQVSQEAPEGMKWSTTEDKFVGDKPIIIVKDVVELPEGCETWMVGEKYPFRYNIDAGRAHSVHRLKKIIYLVIKSLEGWKGLFSLPHFLFNFEKYIDFLYSGLRDVYYAEERFYSPPVRELRRVLHRIDFPNRETDITSAILEYDNAYKYPVQDVLGETNKDNLKKNPLKEVRRLLDLLCDRDPDDWSGFGRMRKMIPFVMLFLRLNKKYRNYAINFLKQLDVDKIKLSKEDIYWTNCIGSDNPYKYRGIDSKVRYQEYLKEKEEWKLSLQV